MDATLKLMSQKENLTCKDTTRKRLDIFRDENLATLEQHNSTIALLKQMLTHLMSSFRDQNSLLSNINTRLDGLKLQANEFEAKLRKREFILSVIGAEKAGKSSLVNGIIGTPVLPTKTERCTYTITEIYSCSTLEEQRYEIDYFTNEEIDARKIDLQSQLQKAGGVEKNNLETELKEILENSEVINGYINGSKPSSKRFNKLSDVEAELKDAITKIGHARAIKSLRIYTTELAQDDDLRLCDVPGFDSPITLHKDHTLTALLNSDAIIYAKDLSRPNFNDVETNFLHIANEQSTNFIKLKDRIIVALTKCDNLNETQFKEGYETAIGEWSKMNIHLDRIVKIGGLSVDDLPSGKEFCRERLKKYGIDGNGIDALKACVREVILQIRFGILEKRIQILSSDIAKVQDDVITFVNRELIPAVNKFQDFDKYSDVVWEKAFNEWWCHEWHLVLADFEAYYQIHVRGKMCSDELPNSHPQSDSFKTKYSELISKSIKSTAYCRNDEDPKMLYRTYGAKEFALSDPMKAHILVREELTRQILESFLSFGSALAEILYHCLEEIVNWIYNRLWHINNIRKYLLEASSAIIAQDILKFKIEALVLRYVRPLASFMLSIPRSNRGNVIKYYEKDIKSLVYFLEENGLDFKDFSIDTRLQTYVKENFTQSSIQIGTLPTDSNTNMDAVLSEIKEDLILFELFCRASVFYAAGIDQYFHQVIEDLRQKFLDSEQNKGLLRTEVKTAIKYFNSGRTIPAPNILQEIANHKSILHLRDELLGTSSVKLTNGDDEFPECNRNINERSRLCRETESDSDCENDFSSPHLISQRSEY